MIGQIGGNHWSAVVTYRHEKIRIISVRRSRDEEVAIYESVRFDQTFDRGEDVTRALDLAAAAVPWEQRRVNVDFPVWMVESLDREASRLGVTRQSLIKVWIAERLEHRDPTAA